MNDEAKDTRLLRAVEASTLIASNMKTAFMRHLTGVYGTDDLEAMFVDLNASSTYNPQHKNARYCVRINKTPSPLESSGKDIIHSHNWFSPCLNAIACFNSYLKNTADARAHIYHAAGYDFGKEWVTARDNAAKYSLYLNSKNVNTRFQLDVIDRLFKGKSAYKITDELGNQTTVERLAKRFKEKYPLLTRE